MSPCASLVFKISSDLHTYVPMGINGDIGATAFAMHIGGGSVGRVWGGGVRWVEWDAVEYNGHSLGKSCPVVADICTVWHGGRCIASSFLVLMGRGRRMGKEAWTKLTVLTQRAG